MFGFTVGYGTREVQELSDQSEAPRRPEGAGHQVGQSAGCAEGMVL